MGSAWPPHLCNGIKKHDTYLNPLILHFLSRKCGNPAADYDTIAPTPDRIVFSVGPRSATPNDAQTPCLLGEIFPVHQIGIF